MKIFLSKRYFDTLRLIIAFVVLAAFVLAGEATTDPRFPDGPWFNLEGLLLVCLVAGILAIGIGAVLFVTGRLLFTFAVAYCLMAAVYVASKIKMKYLGVRLLFPDLYFHLRETSEIAFFIDHYFPLAAAAAFSGVFVVILSVFLFKWDPIRIPRAISVIVLIIGTGLSLVGVKSVTSGLKADVFFRAAYNERHFSSLLISAVAFTEAVQKPLSIVTPTVEEQYTANPVPQLLGSEIADAERPTIIAVLHESSVIQAYILRESSIRCQRSFLPQVTVSAADLM